MAFTAKNGTGTVFTFKSTVNGSSEHVGHFHCDSTVLAAGAATATNQATGNASLATLAAAVTANKVQAEITNTPAVTVSGVSTAANQATGNASLATIAGAVSAGKVQTEITNTPAVTVSGVSTAANQSTGNASLATLAGAVSAAKVQCEITNTPSVNATVSGVSTAANQATGNASLSTIAGAVSSGKVNVAVDQGGTLAYGNGTCNGFAQRLIVSSTVPANGIVLVSAHPDNDEEIYFGDASVADETGLAVSAGSSGVPIAINDANKVYVRGKTTTCKYSWMCAT